MRRAATMAEILRAKVCGYRTRLYGLTERVSERWCLGAFARAARSGSTRSLVVRLGLSPQTKAEAFADMDLAMPVRPEVKTEPVVVVGRDRLERSPVRVEAWLAVGGHRASFRQGNPFELHPVRRFENGADQLAAQKIRCESEHEVRAEPANVDRLVTATISELVEVTGGDGVQRCFVVVADRGLGPNLERRSEPSAQLLIGGRVAGPQLDTVRTGDHHIAIGIGARLVVEQTLDAHESAGGLAACDLPVGRDERKAPVTSDPACLDHRRVEPFTTHRLDRIPPELEDLE